MLLNVNVSYKNLFYFRCFYIEELIINVSKYLFKSLKINNA